MSPPQVEKTGENRPIRPLTLRWIQLEKELAYNKSMPKTDFEKLLEERSAATLLRDEMCFLVGWTKAEHPEIAERLEKALKEHEEKRCQDWL